MAAASPAPLPLVGLFVEALSPVGTQLLTAWIAWDANPSRVETAARMEDACWAAADQLGTDATSLRTVLTAFARKDVAKRVALSEVGL